jgi:hypothetical protein
MLKGSAITMTYTAGITALLMLIFPKFRDDVELVWYNIHNGAGLGITAHWLNSGNFFPLFLGLCGVGCGFLMWWHNRPN